MSTQPKNDTPTGRLSDIRVLIPTGNYTGEIHSLVENIHLCQHYVFKNEELYPDLTQAIPEPLFSQKC